MAVKNSLKNIGIRANLIPPVFQTHYKNHIYEPEINDLPSATVPNQSMKISEILTRFTKGLPISGEKVPMYHGEEGIIDKSEFARLDLSEQQEVLAQARLNTQKTLDALRRKKQKTDQEAQEKVFREKFEREMSSRNNPDPTPKNENNSGKEN